MPGVVLRGGVAQLGERLNGIQEVRGSIPLASTAGPEREPGAVWIVGRLDVTGQVGPSLRE